MPTKQHDRERLRDARRAFEDNRKACAEVCAKECDVVLLDLSRTDSYFEYDYRTKQPADSHFGVVMDTLAGSPAARRECREINRKLDERDNARRNAERRAALAAEAAA